MNFKTTNFYKFNITSSTAVYIILRKSIPVTTIIMTLQTISNSKLQILIYNFNIRT